MADALKAATKGSGSLVRIIIALVFLLAGIYSILQLVGVFIPVEVSGEYLLWITSIGCLLFGFLFLFKKKK